MTRHQDRVDRHVGVGAVATVAVNPDRDPIRCGHHRTRADSDLARLERAIDPAAAAADGPAADAFVVRIERLCALVAAPARLRDLGLRRDRIGWLAANSGGASMRGNPVALEAADLLPILEAIY